MITKEVLYKQLSSYIEDNKIANLEIFQNNHRLIIKNRLFNSTIINCLLGLGVSIFCITYDFIFIGILLVSMNSYFLYADLKSINITNIEFEQEQIEVIPIIGKTRYFEFNEISCFTIQPSAQGFNLARYRVTCELITGKKIILFDLKLEDSALFFLKTLSKLTN